MGGGAKGPFRGVIHVVLAQDMEFCSHIVRVIVAGNAITDKPTKTATVKDTKVERTYCVNSYNTPVSFAPTD